MYHCRERKDVTEFTDGCDLAQNLSGHLLRWTDVVQDFYSGERLTANWKRGRFAHAALSEGATPCLLKEGRRSRNEFILVADRHSRDAVSE